MLLERSLHASRLHFERRWVSYDAYRIPKAPAPDGEQNERRRCGESCTAVDETRCFPEKVAVRKKKETLETEVKEKS